MEMSAAIALAAAFLAILILAITLARFVRKIKSRPEDSPEPPEEITDRNAEIDRLLSEFEGQRLRNQSDDQDK